MLKINLFSCISNTTLKRQCFVFLFPEVKYKEMNRCGYLPILDYKYFQVETPWRKIIKNTKRLRRPEFIIIAWSRVTRVLQFVLFIAGWGTLSFSFPPLPLVSHWSWEIWIGPFFLSHIMTEQWETKVHFFHLFWIFESIWHDFLEPINMALGETIGGYVALSWYVHGTERNTISLTNVY